MSDEEDQAVSRAGPWHAWPQAFSPLAGSALRNGWGLADHAMEAVEAMLSVKDATEGQPAFAFGFG